METKTTRHSKYNIYYHLVWIPKYCKKVLGETVKQRLEGILMEIKWTNAYYVGTAGTVSKETIQKYVEEQTKCQSQSQDMSVESE